MTETSTRDRLAIQQLVLLNRIALLAVQDLGALQPMLQRIVEELQQEFGWEFVACASIDKNSNEFVCQAVCSRIPTQIRVGYRRGLGTGVVGECATTGKTIDIEDTRGHPNFIETLDCTLSELCVPVIHNGEVLAVLNAESLEVGKFTGQRRLLETIAAQIAGAIYTANLYSHLQETHLQLQHAYRSNDSVAAYEPIVGAGANGCVLHYRANNARMLDGDLLLVDAGAEYANYASDITRTWPVNGVYSKEQRALYEIVLAAQAAALAQARPGRSWIAGHHAAVEVITDGLLSLGLLKGTLKQNLATAAYKKFYMHKTGHWIGLDVHDVGEYKVAGEFRELEPGMVFTIEPGLYIAPGTKGVPAKYQGIGIRIEDDVLVTKDGHRVLTEAVPKEIDAVEAVLASR